MLSKVARTLRSSSDVKNVSGKLVEFMEVPHPFPALIRPIGYPLSDPNFSHPKTLTDRIFVSNNKFNLLFGSITLGKTSFSTWQESFYLYKTAELLPSAMFLYAEDPEVGVAHDSLPQAVFFSEVLKNFHDPVEGAKKLIAFFHESIALLKLDQNLNYMEGGTYVNKLDTLIRAIYLVNSVETDELLKSDEMIRRYLDFIIPFDEVGLWRASFNPSRPNRHKEHILNWPLPLTDYKGFRDKLADEVLPVYAQNFHDIHILEKHRPDFIGKDNNRLRAYAGELSERMVRSYLMGFFATGELRFVSKILEVASVQSETVVTTDGDWLLKLHAEAEKTGFGKGLLPAAHASDPAKYFAASIPHHALLILQNLFLQHTRVCMQMHEEHSKLSLDISDTNNHPQALIEARRARLNRHLAHLNNSKQSAEDEDAADVQLPEPSVRHIGKMSPPVEPKSKFLRRRFQIVDDLLKFADAALKVSGDRSLGSPASLQILRHYRHLENYFDEPQRIKYRDPREVCALGSPRSLEIIEEKDLKVLPYASDETRVKALEAERTALINQLHALPALTESSGGQDSSASLSTLSSDLERRIHELELQIEENTVLDSSVKYSDHLMVLHEVHEREKKRKRRINKMYGFKEEPQGIAMPLNLHFMEKHVQHLADAGLRVKLDKLATKAEQALPLAFQAISHSNVAQIPSTSLDTSHSPSSEGLSDLTPVEKRDPLVPRVYDASEFVPQSAGQLNLRSNQNRIVFSVDGVRESAADLDRINRGIRRPDEKEALEAYKNAWIEREKVMHDRKKAFYKESVLTRNVKTQHGVAADDGERKDVKQSWPFDGVDIVDVDKLEEDMELK